MFRERTDGGTGSRTDSLECLEVFFSEPDTRGRRLPVSGRVTDQQDELDSGRPPRSRGQRFALIFLTFEITVEGEGLVGNFGNVALD